MTNEIQGNLNIPSKLHDNFLDRNAVSLSKYQNFSYIGDIMNIQ